MNPKIWNDFVIFSKAQLESGDIDPAYPILKRALEGLPREQQLWRLFLFVTYYHLGSAETAWTQYPNQISTLPVLPTGVERRGMRGNQERLNKWAKSLCERTESYAGFEMWINSTAAHSGWDGIRSQFEKLNGAGPWASYKWADLLKNVLGYPIIATDIGSEGGPIPGLKRLVGEADWFLTSPTAHALRVYKIALGEGIPFQGLDQFETALCDFNSMSKGHYYVGADIDAMMTQLNPGSPMWLFRRGSFDAKWLGEVGGWTGVQKDRLKVYAETGEVVLR